MQPTNLSEYYSSLGQRLPSVAERATEAQRAGITDYRGTAGQNRQLLSYLTAPQATQQPQNNDIDLAKVQSVQLPQSIPTLDTPLLTSPILQRVPTTSEITTDSLSTDRATLESEISILEERIRNRSTQQETLYDEAGLYDDIRTLNELKGSLGIANAEVTRVNNEGLAIPITARQQLRGRGATTTEFGQTTAPRLENNALEALTASSNAANLAARAEAMQSIVTANQERIDNFINTQKEADALIYTQKNARLNQIESLYSGLLSDEQAIKLEEAKASATLIKGVADGISDEKKRWADYFLEEGDTDTALRITSAENIDQINNIVSGSNTNASNTLVSNAYQKASTTINMIDDLLGMDGLEAAVGPNIFNRSLALFGGSGDRRDFIASLDNVVESLTVAELGRLKEQLGAVAAIANSDTERKGLQNSLIALGERKAGGPVKITEKQFKETMEAVKVVYALDALNVSATPAEKAVRSTWSKDKILEEYKNSVRQISERGVAVTQEDIYTNELGFRNVDSDTNTAMAGTVAFIKEQEGFSPTAYRDGNGYSIGYGNQRHLDGRPVQAGDVISPAEAEQYLVAGIQEHSNWRNLVRVPLTPAQQTALTSFEYNLGPAIWNSGESARAIINEINNGNMERAAELMQQFNKSQGRTLSVLQNRRALEGQLLTNFT